MKKYMLLSILLLIIWATQGWCVSNKRALVIGNSAYQNAPLRNPLHDAHDIATTLEKVGFIVTQKTNIPQPEMEAAIRTFGEQIQPHDIALFYFSGHGVQIDGINYLLPIGTPIYSEDEVKYNAVAAQMVLDRLERAESRLNILILDACRNNPFRGFRSLHQGLAEMSSPAGTLISYATSPGTVAYDGNERNSPYTKYLVETIQTPGLKIEETFKYVRIAVMADTNNKQVPWESSSLTGDFYFTPLPLLQSVYLSELQPQKVLVGYGMFSIGRYGDNIQQQGERIFTHGTQYSHGLYAHAPSQLVYELQGQFSELSTTMTLVDTATCGDGAIFIIKVDGRERFKSQKILSTSVPQTVQVNVTGGRRLELITEEGNSNNKDCDWTIWGDPILR